MNMANARRHAVRILLEQARAARRGGSLLRRHSLPGPGGLSILSTLATLAVGCLIDGAIVAQLAYITDGRRGGRLSYGTRRAGTLRSIGSETRESPRA